MAVLAACMAYRSSAFSPVAPAVRTVLHGHEYSPNDKIPFSQGQSCLSVSSAMLLGFEAQIVRRRVRTRGELHSINRAGRRSIRTWFVLILESHKYLFCHENCEWTLGSKPC